MVVSVALLLLQIGLQFELVRLSRVGMRQSLLVNYFNPICFVVLFSILFFTLPQLYGMANQFHIIGFEHLSEADRAKHFRTGQLFLVYFYFSALVGVAFAQLLTRHDLGAVRTVSSCVYKSKATSTWLNCLFLIGLAANVYLGLKFASVSGFRSELVKSNDGKVATLLVFFGSFALVALCASEIMRGKLVSVAIRVTMYGGAVLMTGSRGRLLWPLAILVMVLAVERNAVAKSGTLLRGVGFAGVLLVMDPLSHYIRTGDPSQLSRFATLSKIFEKRNFDGFANLTLIVGGGASTPDSSLLVSGARDAFMYSYYPEVYERGVGFGVTTPGWFYLAGGFWGFVALSVCFGAFMQLGVGWLRRQTSLLNVIGYFFAVVWIAAIGGNLIESVDKAIASAAPAVLTAMYLSARGIQDYRMVLDVSSSVESGLPRLGDRSAGERHGGV